MTQEQLFEAALMVSPPWFISDIKYDPSKGRLDISIDFERGSSFHYENSTEEIAGEFKAYDTVHKTWRHLNFFSTSVTFMLLFHDWILAMARRG